MNTKKYLSAVVVTALISSSVLPWIASAKITTSAVSSGGYSTYSDYSKKTKKFVALKKKVLQMVATDYKKAVAKLVNQDAQKAYNSEYASIEKAIGLVFDNATNGYDSMLPTYIDNLKKEIRNYKDLRWEIQSLQSDVNPFELSIEDVASVEADMIDFQKIVTSVLRTAVDSYSTSDFKETGKMNIGAEGSFGKIDLVVEKYTKIFSLLTMSQEADVTAKADFSINMPGSYEYDTATNDYKKTTGETVTGSLSIDVSVKMIDKDMYVTLQDFSLSTSFSGIPQEAIDNINAYKGKTIKIPLSDSLKDSTGGFDQTETLSRLKLLLSILEEQSLLAPYKKIGDIYSLTLRDDTVKSIGAVFEEDISDADIKIAKKEMKQTPIRYKVSGGEKTIFMNINERDATGKASLSNSAGEYNFLLDVKNPKKTSDTVHLLVKKGFVDGKMNAEGVNVNLSYKDGQLLFTGEGMAQNFKIEWALSLEKTNLDFTFNGKKIGNITWAKSGSTYTYDILFETTLSEIPLSKIHISGETKVDRGNFPITVPKDSVELDSITGNKSVPSNFSDLK